MAGSLIFVAYSNAKGDNVTVSPRLGTGHVMPQYASNINMTIFEGSGIIGDTFVVNAKCTNCRSWGSGKIDVSTTSQPIIWAFGDEDNEVKSDSPSAPIQQHSLEPGFFNNMNLQQATGTGGVPTNSTNSTSTTGQQGQGTQPGSYDSDTGRILHGLLMCGTFVILFPAGFLFLRLFERVWIHMALQSLGAFVFLVGAAAGIVITLKDKLVRTHPHF